MNETTQISKYNELAFSLPQTTPKPAASSNRVSDLLCGQQQSPVSITRAVQDTTLPPLEFNYKVIPVRLLHHGSAIQIACELNNSLVFDGQTYRLEQIHFHLPGEHRVNGRFYPMCLHLVHRDSEGRLAVVELALEYGKENAFLVRLWERLQDRTRSLFMLNPAELIGNDQSYYTYQGSLTTAPYTEGVRWLVLKHPAQVSLAQVSEYLEQFGNNARPLQPLNQRIIKEYQAILSPM